MTDTQSNVAFMTKQHKHFGSVFSFNLSNWYIQARQTTTTCFKRLLDAVHNVYNANN